MRIIIGKRAWTEMRRKGVASCVGQHVMCGVRRFSTEPVPSKEQRQRQLEEIKHKANRILSNYPLILSDSQKSRPSLYEPVPEWWPTLEKMLRPMKRFLALMISKSIINQRFSKVDPSYFPETFMQGANMAAFSFLSNLSNWSGESDSSKTFSLKATLKPRLYKALESIHEELAELGYTLSIVVDRNNPQSTKVNEIFFVFGPPSSVKSTFMSGSDITHVGNGVIKKISDGYSSYRKLNFEHTFPTSEFEENGGKIDGQLLKTSILAGQMFAIDVEFNISFNSFLVPIENGEREAINLGERDGNLVLRFESDYLPVPHTTGSNWFIADIDNYFIEKLRKEEDLR